MKSGANQIHTEFRVFVGKAQKGNPVAALAKKAQDFVTTEQVSPKSIGVEYLESTRQVILTLGYKRDASPYEISIVARSLGTVPDTKAASLRALESRMSAAASELSGVICHELMVSETGELTMVFMIRR